MGRSANMPNLAEDEGAFGMHSIHHSSPCFYMLIGEDPRRMREPTPNPPTLTNKNSYPNSMLLGSQKKIVMTRKLQSLLKCQTNLIHVTHDQVCFDAVACHG